MSITIMSAVWAAPVASTHKLILLSLADQADDRGYCWPSFQHTANRTGLTRRTVIRTIAELQQLGVLQCVPRSSNGRHKTNDYRIIVDALREMVTQDHQGSDTGSLPVVTDDHQVVTQDHQGSDTRSLLVVTDDHQVVTQDHQGSDTRSLPVVTDDHQGSDRVSPKSSMNPQLNHQKNREGDPRAREVAATSVQRNVADSPSPPENKVRIADRTPDGFRKLNGYHPPPEPVSVVEAARPERVAVGEMANALTEVTGVSARLNWPEVGGFAEELVANGYTADQLRDYYGTRKVADKWHWYESDWRGKKGDRPRLREIRETIAGAVAWRPAAQVQQENSGQSWIERSLALARANGLIPQTQTE